MLPIGNQSTRNSIYANPGGTDLVTHKRKVFQANDHTSLIRIKIKGASWKSSESIWISFRSGGQLLCLKCRCQISLHHAVPVCAQAVEGMSQKSFRPLECL